MEPIKTGLTNETSHVINENHLASTWGSGLLDVLATPVLVAFCEECARLVVEPFLSSNEQTVGTEIRMKHLVATPPGMRVKVRAELIKHDNRRLEFHIEAWDDVDKIADGNHQRFIINVDRFMENLGAKLEANQKL